MKLINVRFKLGLKNKVSKKQKKYTYFCPIDSIKVGDYVIVDVWNHSLLVGDFGIARVEEVFDYKYKTAFEKKVTGGVLSIVPIKDMDARCDSVLKVKYKLKNSYKNSEKKQKEIEEQDIDDDRTLPCPLKEAKKVRLNRIASSRKKSIKKLIKENNETLPKDVELAVKKVY